MKKSKITYTVRKKKNEDEKIFSSHTNLKAALNAAKKRGDKYIVWGSDGTAWTGDPNFPTRFFE